MNNSPRKHAGISWFILGTGILLAVIGAMTAKAYKVNPCLFDWGIGYYWWHCVSSCHGEVPLLRSFTRWI